MTENEAVEVLKDEHSYGYELNKACLIAIKALKEIQQYRAIGKVEEVKYLVDSYNGIMHDFGDGMMALEQYRAIGTIEEFKRAKEMEAVYGQVKWERDVAISQLKEIGVSLGQKMDEFKDLKEYKAKMEMQYLDDINNPLEPLKLSSALQSEIRKYEYRKEHKPQDISPLDYTIMYALKHCLEET